MIIIIFRLTMFLYLRTFKVYQFMFTVMKQGKHYLPHTRPAAQEKFKRKTIINKMR